MPSSSACTIVNSLDAESEPGSVTKIPRSRKSLFALPFEDARKVYPCDRCVKHQTIPHSNALPIAQYVLTPTLDSPALGRDFCCPAFGVGPNPGGGPTTESPGGGWTLGPWS